MPHATSTGGLRIHYSLEGGEGPPVVLLQGLGLSGRYWGDLPQTLLTPAAPYRVLVVDNRGSGASEGARAPYGTGAMADDVRAVLDHAGLDAAYVAGISMGGMIAQQVAIRHPTRVRGLVLIATSAGLPHARLPTPSAVALLSSAPFALARGAHAKLFERMFFATRPPAEARRLADEMVAQWRDVLALERMSVGAYFLQLAAIVRHSAGFQLPAVTCPTHVVAGTDDALVPPVNAEILARRIPGATLELLAGVGHAVPVEDRDVLRRSLARLREIEAPARTASAA